MTTTTTPRPWQGAARRPLPPTAHCRHAQGRRSPRRGLRQAATALYRSPPAERDASALTGQPWQAP
eukprot:2389137-Lingulodinium_polyedra.AAC.1